MTPAEFIQQLNDPEALMRHCLLMISGGMGNAPANGQAAPATFKVSFAEGKDVKGFTTGLSGLTGRTKKRHYVRITKQPGAAKPTPGQDEFNAFYVPMVQTSDVASGHSHYTLPTSGGPDLMVTSKLSGCTFGVGSDASGAKMVTHIQPNLSTGAGPARVSELSGAVGQGFQSQTGSFARRAEYADTATVIGYRKKAVWSFYMQATGYKDSTNVISSVTVVQ